MAKFLAPPAFPRRPSGFRRYAIVGGLILLVLWTFYHSSSEVVRLDPNTNLPSSDFNAEPGHAAGHDLGTPPSYDANTPVGNSDNSLSGAGKTETEKAAPKDGPGGSDLNTKPKPPKPAAGGKPKTTSKNRHPIDKLIYDAQHRFAAISSAESKTVSEAAQAYRKRRGRHPPPNFDKWFEFARSQNAVIVEEFFDQIYHDLGPFWAADAAAMRREASQFEMTINVRNGTATAGSDWFWTKIWLNMTKSIEEYLPDMDLALNAMDEPRIVVPFDEIHSHMKNASKTIKLPKAKTMVNKFQTWPAPGTGKLEGPTKDKNWEGTSKHFKPQFH